MSAGRWPAIPAIRPQRTRRPNRPTQPETFKALALNEDGPTRGKFLARLHGEVSKRGTIDMLRHDIRHGAHDLDLFYGTPSPGNEQARGRFVRNRFTVTRQLGYSRNETQQALDGLVRGAKREDIPASLTRHVAGKLESLGEALCLELGTNDRFMLADLLREHDTLEERIVSCTKRINEKMRPRDKQLDLLTTVPGIDRDPASATSRAAPLRSFRLHICFTGKSGTTSKSPLPPMRSAGLRGI